MHNENQRRIFLLLRLLYDQTDEDHYISVADILQFWKNNGILAGRKSVYSDIDLLMEMGVDIICIKSTQNRYFIGSRLFQVPELKLLVDAVESSHFITEKKSKILIEKLGHLTNKYVANQLNRHIYMDGTTKPDNETIYYTIDEIQTAIQEKCPISFQYFEYTQDKKKVLKHDGYRYVFSPYAMIWNRDYYYVVGWSEKHEKLAQFRVDRITAIEHLNSGYIEDEAFNPATYVQEVFGMYNDDTCAVKLLCHNSTMRNVIDRFGEDVDTSPVDAEHFRVTVNVAPSPPFFSWVFTFGGCIQIEGPDSVLEEIRQMAKWLST